MITTGLIEGNHIKNIRANPDSDYHRDMIQFLTNGTDIPSTDVVIRGNILNSGDSEAASQSIFMRNEAVDSQGAGRGMYYSNFLIEDNVIYNAHSNAIWVGYADGLSIRNNTLLQNTASAARNALHTPMITVANSSDVDISKNIAHKILTSNISGLTNSGNYIVQRVDSLADNFYDKLFVATDPGAPVEALQALPGGTIEQARGRRGFDEVRLAARRADRPGAARRRQGHASLRRPPLGGAGRVHRHLGNLPLGFRRRHVRQGHEGEPQLRHAR